MEKIKIHGGGKSIRNFPHVSDFASSPINHQKSKNGEVFNIKANLKLG